MSCARRSLDKIKRVSKSWEALSPEKSFGGMTLKQFQETIQPVLDARDAIIVAETNLITAQNLRETADRTALEAIQRVVCGVKADPTEGNDSDLYEAMGYIPKSARKSGMRRKANRDATQRSPTQP